MLAILYVAECLIFWLISKGSRLRPDGCLPDASPNACPFYRKSRTCLYPSSSCAIICSVSIFMSNALLIGGSCCLLEDMVLSFCFAEVAATNHPKKTCVTVSSATETILPNRLRQ